MNDIKKAMMNHLGYEGFGIQFIQPKKVLVERENLKEEIIENVDSIDIISHGNNVSIDINYNVSNGNESSTSSSLDYYKKIVILD